MLKTLPIAGGWVCLAVAHPLHNYSAMHNNVLCYPASALPWLAAILVGGSAHLGWFANDVVSKATTPPAARAEQVVVVEAARPAPVPEPPAPTCPSVVPVHADLSASPAVSDRLGVFRMLEIQCTEEHSCSILGSGLQQLLRLPMLLRRQARVVPAVRDGEQVGFKLYGLRKHANPLTHLGFKNGDTLRAINGYGLTSVDHALSGMMSLPREPKESFEVEIDRRGERITKTFHLR